MNPDEPIYESTQPQSPIPRVPINRLLLFRLQTFISVLLLGVTLAAYALRTQPDEFLKIVASPFGGLSVAVFVLFLTAAAITELSPGRSWSLKQMLASLGVLLAVGIGMQFLMGSILTIGGTLSKLLFLYSMLFSVVALIYFRVRNLWTMAAITGVCEGIVVYLVFFSR